MSGEKKVKRVFRTFWAWNDEKEERWLTERAREGWHLKSLWAFGCTLERGEPAKVAYRLDYQRVMGKGLEEYVGIFRDAGWEHVSECANWHYFRKPYEGDQPPEIFTDPDSRIAKYRRVTAILVFLMTLVVVVLGPAFAPAQHSGLYEVVYGVALLLKVFAVGILGYAIVRMVLLVNRLKKAKFRQV